MGITAEESESKAFVAYLNGTRLFQGTIDAAVEGDRSVVAALFRVIRDPFRVHEGYERWALPPADTLQNSMLSCSS